MAGRLAMAPGGMGYYLLPGLQNPMQGYSCSLVFITCCGGGGLQ